MSSVVFAKYVLCYAADVHHQESYIEEEVHNRYTVGLDANLLVPKGEKPILIWWTNDIFPHAKSPKTHEIYCDQGACLTSIDKSLRENPATRAFIFYGTDMRADNLPLPRRAWHQWALFHEESPKNNWMLTYEDALRSGEWERARLCYMLTLTLFVSTFYLSVCISLSTFLPTYLLPIYLSIYLSICLSVHLSVYLPMYLICLSVCLSVCLACCLLVYLSIHPSIYLFIHPSTHLSINPSIYLCVYLSIYLSIYLSMCLCLFICLSICLPICLSVCLCM